MRQIHRAIGLGLALGVVWLAGCASTGPRQTADSAKPTLGVRITNYGKYEDAGWEHLRSLGITHVFIRVPDQDQVEATRAKLAGYGMDTPVLQGVADLSKEDCVEDLGRQLDVCKQMDAKFMFLSAKLRGAPREVVLHRLRRAGDIARVHGITIVLETHPELGTNADVHRETMQALDHPNIRVNFDTGNVTYYNRDRNAVTELKRIIDLVAAVEIKDHNGAFETWNFPALGKGAVDIPGVLRVLRKHKYSGPITIELEGVKGVERSEAQIKNEVAESVAYLRSIESFR